MGGDLIPSLNMEMFRRYRGPILGITMQCGHEFVLTEPMTRWFREQLKLDVKLDDHRAKPKHFPGARPGDYVEIFYRHVIGQIGEIVIKSRPMNLTRTFTHKVLFDYDDMVHLIRWSMDWEDAYYNGKKVGRMKGNKKTALGRREEIRGESNPPRRY